MNKNNQMPPESAAPTGLLQQGGPIVTRGVRIWDSSRPPGMQFHDPRRATSQRSLLDFDIFELDLRGRHGR